MKFSCVYAIGMERIIRLWKNNHRSLWFKAFRDVITTVDYCWWNCAL